MSYINIKVVLKRKLEFLISTNKSNCKLHRYFKVSCATHKN